MTLPADHAIEQYLRWFVNEEVLLLKEEILEGLPERVDDANIERLLRALEGDLTATEWEKAVVVCVLAPKKLPQVREYALALRSRLTNPDAIEEVDEALEHYPGDTPQPSIRINAVAAPPQRVSVREPLLGRGEAPEEAGDYELEISLEHLTGALGPLYRLLTADYALHARLKGDPTIRALRHCEWRPLRTLAGKDPGLLASLISEHMAGETLRSVVPAGASGGATYSLVTVDRVAVVGERVAIRGRVVRLRNELRG